MMRLGIIFFVLCCFHSCVEKQDKTFTFNEVGWTLKLPEGFHLLDSSSIAAKRAAGKETIQSSTGKKIDDSGKKVMLSATKNKNNSFTFSLTPFKEDYNGQWQSSNQSIKEVICETLKNEIPHAKLDSSTSVEIIDSVSFTKFMLIVRENDNLIFNFVVLSKLYKGYDFEINYVFHDEKIRSEIEEMLKESKFSK